jgi:hypothetical protein
MYRTLYTMADNYHRNLVDQNIDLQSNLPPKLDTAQKHDFWDIYCYCSMNEQPNEFNHVSSQLH